jgi:hypothetical protein
MSEQREESQEILTALRIHCGGVEFNNDGRVELAIHDIHQQIDAIVLIYKNSTSRVSCPYFDRDKDGISVCRAAENKSFRSRPMDDDQLPHCAYSHDHPGERENNLTQHEVPQDEAEFENELNMRKSQADEDSISPEDYRPEL